MQHGITHKNSSNANPNYVPIGNSILISKRITQSIPLVNNGKSIGDYTPFYFATRTPMLYDIQTGYSVTQVAPQDIVYCVCHTTDIVKQGLDFVFTDGHAVDCLSDFYAPKDLVNIEHILDLEAIETRKWGGQYGTDIKRKKEAEFLVLGDIPTSCVKGYAVYNEPAKQQLVSFGIPSRRIGIRQHFYY